MKGQKESWVQLQFYSPYLVPTLKSGYITCGLEYDFMGNLVPGTFEPTNKVKLFDEGQPKTKAKETWVEQNFMLHKPHN